MTKSKNTSVEKLMAVVAALFIILGFVLFFVMLSPANYNVENIFTLQNDKNSYLTFLLGFFIFLIFVSFKTLIRLRWDRKYDSIPILRKKIIYKKSKMQIFISTILLITTFLLIAYLPNFYNGLYMIFTSISFSIALGLLVDSYRLDDTLSSITGIPNIDPDSNEKLQMSGELLSDQISEAISNTHHNL